MVSRPPGSARYCRLPSSMIAYMSRPVRNCHASAKTVIVGGPGPGDHRGLRIAVPPDHVAPAAVDLVAVGVAQRVLVRLVPLRPPHVLLQPRPGGVELVE